MQRQGVSSQRGEIEYRRAMVRHEVVPPRTSTDESLPDETARLLEQRMVTTAARIRQVASEGTVLAPYLEIGAERGQRALVLENDFGAHGAAADISLDMLKSSAHWARRLARPKLPLRVCCDAHTLPFRSGTLPLVFCYQTLHHFPDPEPILNQISRVLAPGGTFVFDEEPFRRALRQHFFHPNDPGPSAGRARRALHSVLQFFSDPGQDEVRYGIVENHSISTTRWRSLLERFSERDVTLSSVRGLVRSPLDSQWNPLARAVHHLFGGSIGGQCRKSGGPASAPVRIEDVLACPTCVEAGADRPIQQSGDAWVCVGCGARYPVVDGVLLLLVPEKRVALYPEQGAR
jgi:ubiquinone/menaquinone biosynthesis C-methylase UbiE